MRQSHLFPHTQRSSASADISRNAILLEQGGFIKKLMAGVYSFLPLGWRVLKKIEHIIRTEMNAAGGQELFLPALHPIEHYEQTGRQNIDVLFHLESAAKKKMVLGQSHEEIIVPLVKQYLASYKSLPLYLYQIQVKFRNELRAKSGLLRSREFLMKDLYSFHRNEADLEQYYELMKRSYLNIFSRVGLAHQTYITYASGGTFSPFSHEFQTITEAGEDTIHVCEECRNAVNAELIQQYPACPNCHNASLIAKKAIEVGNIFPLKTQFSEKFDLTYTDEHGKQQLVFMGCYGIGLGRLLGTIAEVYNDKHGLTWPATVTPFHVHLLNLSAATGSVQHAEKLYQLLRQSGIDTLFDDRQESAGIKFKDADLLGIPIRLVISDKTDDRVELTFRSKKRPELFTIKQCLTTITEYYRGNI